MACNIAQCRQKIAIGLGITAILLLIPGLFLGTLVNNEVDRKLKQMMPLVTGTKTFKYWKNPPIPIHFQFHFFHVINPEEIVTKGAKPVLEERGPYTYLLIDTKENVTHHKNFTVSYNERQTYIFQRHLSVGDENDTFTTINLPLITAISLISNEYSYIQEMTKLMFEITNDEELFKTLSVQDLIWGYSDPLLAAVKKIFDIFDIPFNDRFGFFYQLNNTIANNYTVYTGEDNLNKLSVCTKWNEMSKLPYWTTKQCNMINGTDGNLFHPHIKEEDKLFLFFPQLCRSYYISFETKGSYKGVKYSRFVLEDEIFNNISENPANSGFCTPRNNCLPSGLLNATSCRKGAPVIVSQPHFLGADKAIINSFIGLHPSKELHETYVDLVPLTGTLVRTQRTTQVNMVVENSRYISQTRNIKQFYFPVMFIKEQAALTDDLAAEFRNELQLPLMVVQYTQYTCIALGSVVLVLLLCYLIRTKNTKQLNIHKAKTVNGTEDEKKRLLSADMSSTQE